MNTEMPKKKIPLVNREISWLSFNERVLQEAQDPTVPLIERIRFLAIFSSNLDEFFRVRVAGISRLAKFSETNKIKLNFNAQKLIEKIQNIVIKQQIRFEDIYNNIIIPELAENKIFLIDEKQLNVSRGEYVRNYFHDNILSTLVPIMLDGRRSFPTLKDKAIYLFVKMSNEDGSGKTKTALIEIPTEIHSRFLVLPETGNLKFIILLDDVIRYCLKDIFSLFDFDKFEAYTIKLTRDAELDIDNDLSQSVVEAVAKGLKLRKKGSPVRLVYDSDIPDDLLTNIVLKIGLKASNLLPGGKYHNFSDFFAFPNIGGPQFEYKKFTPLLIRNIPLNSSIIAQIAKQDILINLPYQSYEYVINFLRESAIDPKVKSIKITLYRLAKNSKIINALINAAKNGKKVTVFIELKARFDEEANLRWTEKLIDEGIKVIHGAPHRKIHSKICLVTRLESGKLVNYANLATGNFNEKTALLYGDHSLLTRNSHLTDELAKLFTELERGVVRGTYKHLLVAPKDLRKKINQHIDNEIHLAKKGVKSYMILKMNSLVDDEIINKLYAASNAGVKIKLIVRGICRLVPDVKGFSENIKVISIIDKFLEHARVFIFGNGGKEHIFLSSADLMTRNLDYRIEVAFPIYDEKLKNELRDIIDLQLNDNTKARVIDKKQSNKYRELKLDTNHRSQIDTYKYLLKKSSN